MFRMNRRDFLKASMLVGAGAVLAACGGNAATQAPQGENAPSTQPVKLTIWQSDWGKEWNDPMVKLSDDYKKDVAPNVTVEWTFLPNISEKLVSAITAGNPPDFVTIDEGYGIPKMAIQGGLISLKSYMDAAGIKGTDFIPFTWETVLFKNEPFGVPGGAGTVLMMIQRPVWQDAGIDPASVPEIPTWEQFKEWNNKLYKRDANGKLVRIGQNPLSFSWNNMRGVLGFNDYTDDKTKLLINSPESIKALEEWASLLPKDVSIDDISKAGAGSPTTPYGGWSTGFEGISMDGYWMFSAIDKYYPKIDYFLNKLPTMNGKAEEQKLYTGWVWDEAIPKGSAHPDEAWKFIKYGYCDHGEMLADTLNWTSSLKAFPEFEKRTLALMGGEKNRMAPYLHTFSEVQLVGGWFPKWTPIFNQLNDQFGQASEAVFRRQKTAQQAMDEVVATLQPELDKAQGTY